MLVKHGWKWEAAKHAVHKVTGIPVGNITRYLSGPIQPIPGSLDDLARFVLMKNEGWLDAAREEGFPEQITGA
jgi:hypothetical protein